MFCNLARSANLPQGLYILPMFFLYFYYYYFLMVDFLASIAQTLMAAIFTKISGLVDGCKGLLASLSFFDFSTSQSRKIGVFPGPITFIAMPFGNGMG